MARGRSSQSSGFLWLVIGLAIGLFVAFLVYIQKQPTVSSTKSVEQPTAPSDKTSVPAKKPTASHKDPVEPQAQTDTAEEKHFEYHEMLVEREVDVPSESPPSTLPTQNKSNTPATSNQQEKEKTPTEKPSWLQCGAFRSVEAADGLKAKLTLLGMNAVIKKQTSNNTTWYRVWLGPYASKREAEKHKQQLAKSSQACRIA